ncbi:hypothetical protein Xekk_03602 [Xenorhabdus sp. KK7.4]|nr:hypothetical protein Xekk_03602 [Xenorhabdus sp. KK7.4]
MLLQDLINVRQDISSGDVFQTSILIKSLDGVAGDNVKVKVSTPSGKLPTVNSILIDDELKTRKITGIYDTSVVDGEVVYGLYISGTSYKFTEGINYIVNVMK